MQENVAQSDYSRQAAAADAAETELNPALNKNTITLLNPLRLPLQEGLNQMFLFAKTTHLQPVRLPLQEGPNQRLWFAKDVATAILPKRPTCRPNFRDGRDIDDTVRMLDNGEIKIVRSRASKSCRVQTR